jgi:ubiquinone/menaquinone biosynthesis C-methylase UbiE
LLAANDLGLFTALAQGPQSAADIANIISADPRATELILNACCSLDLLTKHDDRYALTPTAATFLVDASPAYLGSALAWSHDQYRAWGDLATSVRGGRPAVDPHEHLGDDPDQTRAFVIGMHERAAGVARGVIPFIDLEGSRTLLDIGGGPGTYSMLLCEKYPDLTATVLDLPPIVEVAQQLHPPPAPAHLRFLPGDATTGAYGSGQYDAVLFSGVLHQMSPSTIRTMFAGAERALSDGGRVIVSDMMLDPTGTEPAFSSLFSLQMLLTTNAGAVFSAEECAEWLESAGFVRVETRQLPPPLPYTVVRGRKAR